MDDDASGQLESRYQVRAVLHRCMLNFVPLYGPRSAPKVLDPRTPRLLAKISDKTLYTDPGSPSEDNCYGFYF